MVDLSRNSRAAKTWATAHSVVWKKCIRRMIVDLEQSELIKRKQMTE